MGDKLTRRFIEGIKHDGRPSFMGFADGTVKGLQLRVHPSDRKTFVLRYVKPNGKRGFAPVGDYGPLTLTQIRAHASGMLASAQLGKDPQDARHQARTASTVGELCARYMAEHSRPHKKSWKDDESRVGRIVDALGTKLVQEVTRADIADLHATMADTPVLANRVVALVKAIWNWADRVGVVREGLPNPAKYAPRNKEEPRQRAASRDELGMLLACIEEVDDVYVRALLRLYLHTGSRKEELLRLRWDDVDFDRCEIMLRETKNGRDHRVALVGDMAERLAALPRRGGNPYVFPGRIDGAHRATVAKRWCAVRTRAGLDDLTIHDLRRTVGAILNEQGVPHKIIAEILNQKSLATTAAHYTPVSPESSRSALERVAVAMAEIEAGNVVRLDDVRAAKE